jgi:hypothetical protein
LFDVIIEGVVLQTTSNRASVDRLFIMHDEIQMFCVQSQPMKQFPRDCNVRNVNCVHMIKDFLGVLQTVSSCQRSYRS